MTSQNGEEKIISYSFELNFRSLKIRTSFLLVKFVGEFEKNTPNNFWSTNMDKCAQKLFKMCQTWKPPPYNSKTLVILQIFDTWGSVTCVRVIVESSAQAQIKDEIMLEILYIESVDVEFCVFELQLINIKSHSTGNIFLPHPVDILWLSEIPSSFPLYMLCFEHRL